MHKILIRFAIGKIIYIFLNKLYVIYCRLNIGFLLDASSYHKIWILNKNQQAFFL